MILYLTEKEKEWIDMEYCNWHLKEGCPEPIRKTLEPKLKLIKMQDGNIATRIKYMQDLIKNGG